ncbi:cellulose biosynthesis protein BcsG [Limnobacter sp.]|uniref:cellulose biosynthesis protein BcsG n=1 Tax=Limnobacter sp. TaxID=2003368 RepID=UPI002735CC0E|nr:cellulose biosynthesis protein BcsG [Limnobacter sp.]MDP3188274.1 cellulose biosynthesis protein BcsG [Limnobacter sp.]
MLLWNLYFLIKFGLHFSGQLVLSPLLNIALFALLIATNPAAYDNKQLMKVLRYLLFTGPAVALLLHELGLAVSWALVDQIKALFGFSPDYLWELVKRTIQPWMLWGALASFILIRVLDRYLRISTWVGVGLLATMLLQILPMIQPQSPVDSILTNQALAQTRVNLSPAELLALGQVDLKKLRVARDQESAVKLRDDNNDGAGPGATLNSFFERQRNVALTPFAPTTPPDFDVIVLQICSMSWADLQHAKQSRHPLVRQADFMFENFNSATSYSGPAAIRLLRGKCGQTEHNALYNRAANSCMLFDQLRNVGFEVEMGLNHNGRFQDFAKLVQSNLGGQAKQRVAHNEVQTGVQAFDGSRVGRDGDYLRTWWKKRIEQSGPAVAYYYNSITLHDGNRFPNSNLNSLESYPLRLERVLNDLQSVLGEIKRSGRKALVLVVPEHGAGLTGEFGQLVGLRELPTPAITKVPVFGYWVAPGYVASPTGPVTVRQPTSYTALAELLNRWMALPAEQQLRPAWPVLLSDLPSTRFVAQQGNITVMESQGSYWMNAPGIGWKKLGPVQTASAP